MNIDYFREFIVLADCGSYIEASERLFIGQSSLSKHIMTMEKELGVSLFERTSRKVILTRFGELMLPYASRIVQAQYDYRHALQTEQESVHGRITIGTISATAKYGITNLVADFKRRYPNSMIQMFEGDPSDLASHLHNRQCDVIFAHLPENNPLPADFEHIHYLDDSLVCILPRSHPFAGKGELHLEQLQNETFIALAENNTLHQLVLNTCHRVGFSPNIAFLCHRVDSVLDLVTKGMGIALVTEYAAVRPEDGNFPEKAPFATARLLPRTTVSVDMCYRKNESLSPMAKKFVEFVQESVSENRPGMRDTGF